MTTEAGSVHVEHRLAPTAPDLLGCVVHRSGGEELDGDAELRENDLVDRTLYRRARHRELGGPPGLSFFPPPYSLRSRNEIREFSTNTVRTTRIQAAVHTWSPVMVLDGSTFACALARLARAGVPRRDIVEHALKLLGQTRAWVQRDFMRARLDEEVFAWLAAHGANRRVRTFARHGLYLQRSGRERPRP